MTEGESSEGKDHMQWMKLVSQSSFKQGTGGCPERLKRKDVASAEKAVCQTWCMWQGAQCST